MDTGVLEFFNKKFILDYYFCLKSGPVFLFQIFIIAPLLLPRDIKLYHYTPTPQRGRGGVYCFTSVRPSVQGIFRRIFLSNC
jgi:hypothetical protein